MQHNVLLLRLGSLSIELLDSENWPNIRTPPNSWVMFGLSWHGRLLSFSRSPYRGCLRNGRDVDQPGDCVVWVLCGFFSSGVECLVVPSPAVVQQTDLFLPPEVRKGIGMPRLEVFQKRRRVPRPDGFLS